MKKIILLGASGSIGQNTLDVMKSHSDDFDLVGFSIGLKVEKIKEILNEFPNVKAICLKNKEDAEKLQKEYKDLKVFSEDEGLISLLDSVTSDMVVNALVGFVGLAPTVHALNNNIDVALANKETLVVGGELIKGILKNSKAKLYPIDSEHVALDKCLKNQLEVKRIILTASGGSFRNLSREELKNVTKEQALKHPSWNMGNKITIDSATMMNKGFEIIEAHYLFDFPIEHIDILMHDESKVHSLIELEDNSFLADIGPSDMRVPISYALYEGKRHVGNFNKLDLKDFGTWHFHEFDEDRFPCVGYAKLALKIKGTMPCALNAANEVAVNAFLNDEISFLEIENIIKRVMDSHRVIDNPSLEDLKYVDKISRLMALEMVKEVKL